MRLTPLVPALPWLVLGIALAVSFAVRLQVPEVVLATASHDDQLQVRLAHSLRGGEWMGPFDELVLAKGPGYPIFLWLSADLGVPVKAAEGLVQVTAAGLVALAVHRLGGGAVLAAAAGAAVGFDPVYLGEEAARLNRTAFYASVCSCLLAATALTAAPGRGTGGRAALLAAVLGRVGVGALTGLLAAAYWVTREERPWLAPTLVLLTAALLLPGLGRRSGLQRWRVLVPPLVGLLAAGVVAVGGVTEIVQRNDQRYAFAGVNDFTEGAFPALYDALAAIEAGTPRQFVPVSTDQRRAAYAASPVFARVRNGLEVGAAHWLEPGCQSVRVCDDYAGGWFAWALREAVAGELAPSPSPTAYQAYMQEAADEIRAACGIAYACRDAGPSFVPDMRAVPASDVVQAVGRGTVALVTFRGGQVNELPGDPETWADIAATVVGIAPTAEAQPSVPPPGLLAWRAGLSTVLGALLALLALPALIGMTLGVVTGAGGSRAVAVLAVAATVAVLARLGLLVIIDTTSFPAVANGYLMPAFDPALLAALLGTWCLVTVVRHRPRRSRLAHRRLPGSAGGPSLTERITA